MVPRIFKMIATSGFRTASECTKFVIGRGSAPGPAVAAYSAPRPLAGLRGPTLLRKGRRIGKREKGGWEPEGREQGSRLPLSQIPSIDSVIYNR